MIKGTFTGLGGVVKGLVLGTAMAWVGAPWAQSSWQTTHTTNGGFDAGPCELKSAAIRVKVFPAYLDVEEDLEIGATGSVQAGNDPKTLEISGDFWLPAGTAVLGALLWDGDNVLQGKLLDRDKADSLYQSLVDRNSVPPARPRDPILLEMVSKDAYKFRIYPVALGHSRRVRLRYQLPPTLGIEGLQMSLKAAVYSLFPASQAQIAISFEGGAGVKQIVLAMADGGRNTLQLPRTRLMKAADLSGTGETWDMWGNPIPMSGVKLLPVDPLRQVAVKTSMASGLMAGHYLNLYAGVTDDVLGALGRRVEVVILWKWHKPSEWLTTNQYGYTDFNYIYEAQYQAMQLLDLFGQLGGVGSKVGMLHDDSRNPVRGFKASSRGEAEYLAGREYLEHLQGNYIADFANSMKPATRPKPGNKAVAIADSRKRFLENLRLVKSLYSPATGTVRHLLMVSTGPEYATADFPGNAELDSLFKGETLSVGTLAQGGFLQAGFDAWTAHRDHPYSGPMVSTTYASVPGFDALNLNLVVRNEKKAYDFPIRCEGGLSLACGSLTFHGKSEVAWKDSLEWEAYDSNGKSVGTARSLPVTIGGPEDTAIAVLWAGSESPFTENRKELPLGPVYGFVDRWASLVAVPKDSLKSPSAFADTGVPRTVTADLKDVLPNYVDGQVPTTGLVARVGALGDPSAWKIERSRDGFLIRIPGLEAGLKADVALYDLAGKRMRGWTATSGSGMLQVSGAVVAPGAYMLKISIGGASFSRRMAF